MKHMLQFITCFSKGEFKVFDLTFLRFTCPNGDADEAALDLCNKEKKFVLKLLLESEIF